MSAAALPADLAQKSGAKLARLDGIDAAPVNLEPRMPEDVAEILPAFDAALEEARAFLRRSGSPHRSRG